MSRQVKSPDAVLLLALLGLYPMRATQTDTPEVHNESFLLVGLEARTSNAREMTPNGVIPKLWTRSMKEGSVEKIPNRVSSDTIVLYTNYQSDHNGEYTYVLGAKVASPQDVPAGMSVHRVPAGEYARFSAPDGSSPSVIVGLWQHIWSLEDSGQLARAYRTDYEVHHPLQDGKTPLDVYVGLKK